MDIFDQEKQISAQKSVTLHSAEKFKLKYLLKI